MDLQLIGCDDEKKERFFLAILFENLKSSFENKVFVLSTSVTNENKRVFISFANSNLTKLKFSFCMFQWVSLPQDIALFSFDSLDFYSAIILLERKQTQKSFKLTPLVSLPLLCFFATFFYLKEFLVPTIVGKLRTSVLANFAWVNSKWFS